MHIIYLQLLKCLQKPIGKKSSIPSDRYYDDFGLTFDYIKQDSLKPDYHYMTLRADSKQYISPDIYSAQYPPTTLKGSKSLSECYATI